MSLIEKIMYIHDTGGGTTYHAGYSSLNKFYKIKLGNSTDWTGHPTSGKTELLCDILINCSFRNGWRNIVNMPDVGSTEEVYADFIERFTGKTFAKEFYSTKYDKIVETKNRISKDEIVRALQQVQAFVEVVNEEFNGLVSPVEFWQYVAKRSKKESDIKVGVIDSWNFMNLSKGEFSREDQWLADTLAKRNKIQQEHELHFHTVIHPKTLRREDSTSTPTVFDLKGGTEWFNFGRQMIIVDRLPGGNEAKVIVAKSKPRITGTKGEVILNYDYEKRKYYEVIHGKECYAYDFEKLNHKDEFEHSFKQLTPINEDDYKQLDGKTPF